jgi:hypothetical protein
MVNENIEITDIYGNLKNRGNKSLGSSKEGIK